VIALSAVCLFLLLLLGAGCWAWSAVADVESLVRDDFPEERSEVLGVLGSPRSAARKLKFYCMLPERFAEGKWSAMEALELLGPDGVSGLVFLLERGPLELRASAAESLGEIGVADEDVGEALLRAARRGDLETRSEAVQAFHELGFRDPQVAGIVVELIEDPQCWLSDDLADVLGAYRCEARTYVSRLTAVLDRTETTRSAALAALLKVEDDCVGLLTGELGSPDPGRRAGAAWALGELGARAGRAAEKLAALLADPSPRVRRVAGWALTRTGSDGMEVLAGALGSPSVEARRSACFALLDYGRIGPDCGALPVFVNPQRPGGYFCDLKDRHLFWEREEHSQARDRLLRSLAVAVGDADAVVRREALRATGFIGGSGEALAAAVVRGLADSDSRVRECAVWVLSVVDPQNAGNARHYERALADEDYLVRWRAAEALRELGSRATASVPALAEALDDETMLVRWAAANALAAMGPGAAPAVPELTEMVGSFRHTDRSAALEALAAVGATARGAVPEILSKWKSAEKSFGNYGGDVLRNALDRIDPAWRDRPGKATSRR
jgi:HEAT repeat protein